MLEGASEEKATRLHVSCACVLLILSGGCSASMATVQCRRAERLLADVSAPSAARRAPAQLYELTLARAYLDKAREEASEAHYGVALELAAASQRASERVRGSGHGAAKGPH